MCLSVDAFYKMFIGQQDYLVKHIFVRRYIFIENKHRSFLKKTFLDVLSIIAFSNLPIIFQAPKSFLREHA